MHLNTMKLTEIQKYPQLWKETHPQNRKSQYRTLRSIGVSWHKARSKGHPLKDKNCKLETFSSAESALQNRISIKRNFENVSLIIIQNRQRFQENKFQKVSEANMPETPRSSTALKYRKIQ